MVTAGVTRSSFLSLIFGTLLCYRFWQTVLVHCLTQRLLANRTCYVNCSDINFIWVAPCAEILHWYIANSGTLVTNDYRMSVVKSYKNIKTPQCHCSTRFDTSFHHLGNLVSKGKVLKSTVCTCCTVSNFITPLACWSSSLCGSKVVCWLKCCYGGSRSVVDDG